MSYFEKVILPSTKMQKQKSYSIAEAAIILDIPVKEVQKFASNYKNQIGRVRLKIEPDNTVLYNSFVKFFEK